MFRQIVTVKIALNRYKTSIIKPVNAHQALIARSVNIAAFLNDRKRPLALSINNSLTSIFNL